jgi:hypothetical protein
MGLPLNLPYTYHDISDTAKRLLEDNDISDDMVRKIQARWFGHCAMMIIRLCRLHGVKI